MTPTTYFPYRQGQLCCELLPLTKLADAVGTPAYVYSKAALLASYAAYDHAFKDVPHLICYSIKANSNLGVISTLAKVGAGADIVSGGELHRALRALDEVAREVGTRAPVALRVNPDVDPQTHKYIATGLRSAKFGIPYTQALAAFEEAARLPGIQVVGADMHIGSQLTKTSPLGDAVARVAALVKQLRERRIEITTIDVGGGLGIRYHDETPPSHAEYATVLLPALKELGVTVLLEPGRSIVGNAGALLTRVLYHKPTDAKTFVVVDAAMNDLVRPAFYDSYHAIVPVGEAAAGAPVETVDVVGPICESGDFFAKDRALPRPEEGDLLAILSAGAYGFAMASNYNTRPRPVEVLVDGDRYTIVRRRETFDDLVAGETTV